MITIRLWHIDLLPYLPNRQLLGQHREATALRGLGWLKPHSVINYIFNYSPLVLVNYHFKVMEEMHRRGYKVDPLWYNPYYRGKRATPWTDEQFQGIIVNRYPEHNLFYMNECLSNLESKGIIIDLKHVA